MSTFPNIGTPIGPKEPSRPTSTQRIPKTKARLTRRIAACLAALTIIGLPVMAATYKEQAGVVVVEAEHFDTRTSNADGHVWQIMPDENGNPNTAADAGFTNARGDKYMQSEPDAAGGGAS